MKVLYQKIRRRVRRTLLRTLEPCATMTPLISESLDRRLSVNERVKLKLHLLVCTWCLHYMLQLKLIRKVVRLEDFDHAGSSLTPEARERICRSLGQDYRIKQDDHANPAKS